MRCEGYQWSLRITSDGQQEEIPVNPREGDQFRTRLAQRSKSTLPQGRRAHRAAAVRGV